MRDQDLIRQLAALNPVTTADLARLDTASGAALREGIVLTTKSPAQTGRRRLGRRTGITAGLTVTLLGCGIAYAAVHNGWYAQSGGADGITCLSEWANPNEVSWDEEGIATGGPALTSDPVADCQQYQELSERPPVDDPVAFRWHSPSVYVAPRAQVPADATLLVPDPEAGPVFELTLSIFDLVDGLGARCLGTDETVLAARAELDRLGLTDWQVDVVPRAADRSAEKCAEVQVPAEHRIGDEVATPALVVVPEARRDREDSRGTDIDEVVFEIRDALRARITDQCLGIDAARAVVDEEIGALHHWPTTNVVDQDAACTRVYLNVGGSLQVSLYGPEEAAR
ncbi:hypothetical protein [Sanguibacter antarcticus]|uniref:Uncharacterized protein n=1 Tax=Sanguibacter antarcticus TaxID=372484 RepID=A0A2A9E254_9MICO|nr:hypothetical protein [Sanguibacter antarcticus]PFG33028.1 hypothetical protein ATL42_0880 [Sanguibacter antarcticus]